MVIRYFNAILFSLLATLLSVTASVQAEEMQGNATYRLSSGDIIRINVFGEPDLSFEETRLTDAGTFSYPFVGEVKAQGKTAVELAQILTEALRGDYLVDPRVSISVLEYREFYISGEVKQPGGYKYQPGLNLRRAIALAGGLTERASTNRITVVRDQSTDRKPERIALDSPVLPGDTINIDQGFF
ncbi:MAG: polysaccharide export protein [Thiopseudomonas sp.]|nr:polysaccharide export protein [Thiopseudomonas sp.]